MVTRKYPRSFLFLLLHTKNKHLLLPYLFKALSQKLDFCVAQTFVFWFGIRFKLIPLAVREKKGPHTDGKRNYKGAVLSCSDTEP